MKKFLRDILVSQVPGAISRAAKRKIRQGHEGLDSKHRLLVETTTYLPLTIPATLISYDPSITSHYIAAIPFIVLSGFYRYNCMDIFGPLPPEKKDYDIEQKRRKISELEGKVK